jgi:hypothetical protein
MLFRGWLRPCAVQIHGRTESPTRSGFRGARSARRTSQQSASQSMPRPRRALPR